MITPIKDINWDSTSRVYKVQGYINYFNRTQASIRGTTEILTHYNYYISDGTTPKQYSRDAENIILNTKFNPAKQLKITMVSSTFKNFLAIYTEYLKKTGRNPPELPKEHVNSLQYLFDGKFKVTFMGTLVTRKNFSYMIYTGVSFINEPLPTNDFLDDILLRIDGPPEYKILDFFPKSVDHLFFPDGFGYLTLLVLKDNVNMIILANEQDIMQFYEECDHLTNPELQVYFDNLKGKTVKGNVVEYVDGAIRYNRFEDFLCIFK